MATAKLYSANNEEQLYKTSDHYKIYETLDEKNESVQHMKFEINEKGAIKAKDLFTDFRKIKKDREEELKEKILK